VRDAPRAPGAHPPRPQPARSLPFVVRNREDAPMAARIEDYALIGDCQTAALVGRDGSIDWLCMPRFDSGACFAALLGDRSHGCWRIAPAGEVRTVARRYREGTLVLETDLATADGAVTLVDCMPPRSTEPDLVRIVVGTRGRVRMRMELVIRFDYGSIVPWVQTLEGVLRATAGPDTLRLLTPVATHGENFTTVAEFDVAAGDRIPFVLQWHPSHELAPAPVDAEAAVRCTEQWWADWSAGCTYHGPWRAEVLRSLITLKALTYAPTGGIVAAPTTSLPEQLGGVRNWDYRYCWLRDATFTLYALLRSGFELEAQEWRSWLVRAVAGEPSRLQIMYGIAGERRLTELELPWLPGYEGAAPVRIGNAASHQLQLDVYGEVLDALYQCRRTGLDPSPEAWRIECALMRFLDDGWQRPDEGIWEVRGPRRHFTHSKMMAWVAVDRAVKSLKLGGHHGPIERWEKLRDAIHADVCRQGFDAERGAFVKSYGSTHLDASLLMMPLVGFLPAEDPRVRGTVAAIERELLHDGFVARYRTDTDVDALPPGEGMFLPCTFWYADVLALSNRRREAEAVFERLLGVCNDVGLLSEEYDVGARRLVGNFPQAFSHVGLVNTARNLTDTAGPAEERATH
jgi:GH15 family glucan-1,4-alpha-glucosidase